MSHILSGGQPRHRQAVAVLGMVVAMLVPVVGVSAVGVNLSFSVSPPNPATVNVGFPVTVHVQDDAAAALSGVLVTLDFKPGTSGAAILACAQTVASVTAIASNVSGDALFTACTIDQTGTAYQLRARASGATTVFSAAFDVDPGPPDHLVFTSAPASPTPYFLAPQPSVAVVDVGGHVATGDSRLITLSINKNAGTFSCISPLAMNAVAGVASYAGCQQTTLTTGYTLTATTTGLPHNSVTSSPFDVTSGPPVKLLLCWGPTLPCSTTPPAPITGGTAFSVQPVIRVADAAGNTATNDNSTVVNLSILAGTPAAGGPGTLTCAGSLSRTVVLGVGTFGGCAIDKVGTSYRLNGTSLPALTSAQSTAFNVVVGAATKLGFVMQPPASATAGAAFPTSVQVAIQDAGGNTVITGITATISLAIASNPGGGTLGCTGGNSATTISGVASYTNCVISAQGNGYTLAAAATATAPLTTLAGATSTAINVLAPAAAITLTPSATVITWGGSVVLNVHFGTNGAYKPFTIQVSRDGLTWSNIPGAALTTNANGDASYVYGPSDNRYYRVMFAGTPDLQAGLSAVVRIVVRQVNILRPAPGSTVHPITRGTAITFASTIRPNRPELPQAVAHFVVYQLTSAGWSRVLDRMVPVNRADGKALLMITFNTAGQFYVRSQAVPTSSNANSVWSGLVRYVAL